jgi:hypothetical protein
MIAVDTRTSVRFARPYSSRSRLIDGASHASARAHSPVCAHIRLAHSTNGPVRAKSRCVSFHQW